MLLMSLFCLLCISNDLQSAQISVMNNNDMGPGSLRQAVLDANSGDEIVFANTVVGTITLSSQITITTNLTITGPGASVLAISGGTATQIFIIASGGVQVDISGLAFINGFGNAGGAIRVLNTSTLTCTNCTFSCNQATGGGGAITSEENTSLTCTNCTFSGNQAPPRGGAIDSQFSTLLSLTNCTFSNNLTGSSGFGGGINTFDTVLVCTNCTFSGNQAGIFGGGIFADVETSGTATITNCTFSGNHADQGGGMGIISPCFLNNTIVAGNTASTSAPDIFGTITASNEHNFIGDKSGASGITNDKTFLIGQSLSDLLEATGPTSPVLKNNGGPTKTIALVSGSPAINCGLNSDVQGICFDQRGPGFPRIIDCIVDIGAFEFGPSASDIIFSLIECVKSTVCSKPARKELLCLAKNAQLELIKNNFDGAKESLTCFKSEVVKFAGKAFSTLDAQILIEKAELAIKALSCMSS